MKNSIINIHILLFPSKLPPNKLPPEQPQLPNPLQKNSIRSIIQIQLQPNNPSVGLQQSCDAMPI